MSRRNQMEIMASIWSGCHSCHDINPYRTPRICNFVYFVIDWNTLFLANCLSFKRTFIDIAMLSQVNCSFICMKSTFLSICRMFSAVLFCSRPTIFGTCKLKWTFVANEWVKTSWKFDSISSLKCDSHTNWFVLQRQNMSNDWHYGCQTKLLRLILCP